MMPDGTEDAYRLSVTDALFNFIVGLSNPSRTCGRGVRLTRATRVVVNARLGQRAVA